MNKTQILAKIRSAYECHSANMVVDFDTIAPLLAFCYRAGYDDAMGEGLSKPSYPQHLCHGPGDGELT